MTAYTDALTERNRLVRLLLRERGQLDEARARQAELKRYVAPRSEQAEARQAAEALELTVAGLKQQLQAADEALETARTTSRRIG